MDALRATALEKIIDEQLMDRKDVIADEILRGCEEWDSADKIHAQMICNAVGLSVKLTMGLVLDILTDYGILEPADEDRSRRSIISVIK